MNHDLKCRELLTPIASFNKKNSGSEYSDVTGKIPTNMILTLLVFILSTFYCSAVARKELTTDEMIRQNGYPVEIHRTETPDGFMLTLFRIPGRPGSTPVYLQHGLVDSSDSWFSMGRNQSLGFLLSDVGYDVWAGNFRGNVYSFRHRSLKPDSKEYWDFSWDTLGRYDVRVMIQYILQRSRQSQLIHIGHSMGTTSFYVAASIDPQVNRRVRAHIALAPITSFEYSRSPAFSAKFIEPLITTLQSYDEGTLKDDGEGTTSDENEEGIMANLPFDASDAAEAIENVPGISSLSTVSESLKAYISPVSQSVAGYAEMVGFGMERIRETVRDYTGLQYLVKFLSLTLERGEIRGSLIRRYCRMSTVHERLCLRLLSVVSGDDECHMTQELVRLLFSTLPKSSSLKEVVHYLQQRKAGRLYFYDYGTEQDNFREYGSPKPPEVDFRRIKMPVYFIYGKNDLFAAEEDLMAAYRKFGNPAGAISVKRPEWNHADFLITIDIETTLHHETVLNILKRYKKKRY